MGEVQCDCFLLNYPFILDWQNNYVKATYTNYLSVSVCVYCYFRIYSTDSHQIVGSFDKQCQATGQDPTVVFFKMPSE